MSTRLELYKAGKLPCIGKVSQSQSVDRALFHIRYISGKGWSNASISALHFAISNIKNEIKDECKWKIKVNIR